MLKIQVIIGSTRENRFSEKAASWIFEEAKKRPELEVELVDLRDYDLPFFDQPMSPKMSDGKYTNEIAKKWADKIGEADGYIIVSPEYNHGYSAVLKNALDWVYKEWNQKPVGFVSYGGVGGARAVEQLRLVAIELQLMPIHTSINIPWNVYMAVIKPSEDNTEDPYESLETTKTTFLDQLTWATKALKAAR